MSYMVKYRYVENKRKGDVKWIQNYRIVAYLTWIGLLIAILAGDKQGANSM